MFKRRLLFNLATWLAAGRSARVAADAELLRADQRAARPRGLAFDRLRGKIRRTWLRLVRPTE